MMSVPAEVAERIRRPMRSGLSVLPRSLPVVSFGDPDRATVATLSLNPSCERSCRHRVTGWQGRERRLASLVSLGAADPRELDDDRVATAAPQWMNPQAFARSWRPVRAGPRRPAAQFLTPI
jgi:hypothetical protein